MITLKNYQDIIGSTVTVKRTGDNREPYTITGELRMISGKRIILDGAKSGRTCRIPMVRIISIVEVEPEFKVLNFLLDDKVAVLCSKEEVNENE